MVTPGLHYGPSVDGYEYDRWGTYHFADWRGIGVDRTAATGTGYTGQYREPNASLYENPDTCPDALVLFFHHVDYTYMLHSGKTVLQHIYDTHFAGVEAVEGYIEAWGRLDGRVDPDIFALVKARLEIQLASAGIGGT
jgi:alpha-glucuronidase